MKGENIHKKFESVYNQFASGIFRYVYFKVSDYELACDLTEDTFVRYWKVIEKEKEIENHKALLYFIAKGLIVDYYRKKKKNKRVSLDSIDEQLLGMADKTEEVLVQKQELDRVYKKIKTLKKEYQEVLFLHYVEDVTVKEIAFIQKKKENAVRVSLHRAVKALKEVL